MTHAIQRSDIAGRDVTRYLKLLLRKEGATFKTTAEFECVRQIKERCCQLLPSAYGAHGATLPKEEGLDEHMNYTLPDGTIIDVRSLSLSHTYTHSHSHDSTQLAVQFNRFVYTCF